MKIAVACGGTGGHIFPGLATAGTLRQRGHDVTLWLAGRDVESLSLGGWGGGIIRIKSSGLSSSLSLKSFVSMFNMIGAVISSVRIMRLAKPDRLLAMGSYASIGPVLAARYLGVPIILHEANVIPGRAISFLSRYASVVATGFRETANHIKHRRICYTGMPLRNSIKPPVSGSGQQGIKTPCLLIMGGSQGAHRVNEISSEAACLLASTRNGLKVVHLTGSADEELVRRRYSDAGVDAEVYSFLKGMELAYSRASLAVCRAGAASCAELALYGVPALFIPLPSAMRDHQTANANSIAARGGAIMIPEKDLTSQKLYEELDSLFKDSGRLDSMSEGMRNTAVVDAADKLADLVESLA
jgi:UDP-N-acetylglucosamine--N-acetylmuramyl-(pentapeptide) pyrophosphoryl-undecaprenol N-acetylglucosamine transferase